MDLTNKELHFTGVEVISIPPTTTVSIEIIEETHTNIWEVTRKMRIRLDELFHSHDDPRLLSAVAAKLEELP